jgi:hypothetical protein
MHPSTYFCIIKQTPVQAAQPSLLDLGRVAVAGGEVIRCGITQVDLQFLLEMR